MIFMSKTKKNLVHRLKEKGIDLPVIPGFIRSLASSFFLNPNMNLVQVNKRLEYLGWTGVELDYHTFQLALSCFEDEGLNHLQYKSGMWFENLLYSGSGR